MLHSFYEIESSVFQGSQALNMLVANTDSSLRYETLIKQSWPIILANAAIPMLGLVDTAVIGHFGSVDELAALAMAALIFSFVYWSFGFLRMGTTGFVARADGANDQVKLVKSIVQSFAIAFAIALAVLFLQTFILFASTQALATPVQLEQFIHDYFTLRIWGAPGTLITYVVMGVFIGLGDSQKILILQIFLNLTNATLDIALAGVFDMGIRGIALGTMLAEYATCFLGLYFVFRKFPFSSFVQAVKSSELSLGFKSLLSQNTDIFIRTFFLLMSFAFFTRTSGSFGSVTLAATHILLQFVAFSAFFLDGFAYVLESLSGKAVGKKSLTYFNLALKRMFVLSALTTCMLTLTIVLFGELGIDALTNKKEVEDFAQSLLLVVALYVALSFVAYQLDGVFIGVGYSSAMRNCSILSTLVFFLVWFACLEAYGAKGLWLSFVVYVFMRGMSLYLHLPKLKKRYLIDSV